MKDIKAKYAIIGGSSTFSIDFPEEVDGFEIHTVDTLIPSTPFGEGPLIKIFDIKAADGQLRRAITAKMHGWRTDVPRSEASKQLFWLLGRAGVERIISEGGVGSISQLLELRDLVIPTDFIDFSKNSVSLGSGKLLIMRDPFCEEIRSCLFDSASPLFPRIFKRGVYLSTEGQRFESVAEISMSKVWGADYVGQSAVPEVYLAREVGACYAGAHLVVNYAEGQIRPWKHDELKEIFFRDSKLMGRLLLETVISIPDERKCDCTNLAKESLLKSEGSTPPSRT